MSQYNGVPLYLPCIPATALIVGESKSTETEIPS